MSEQKVRNRPEISVIVPVYRVEKYLNDCIDSILAQTFADFELILVDDGSRTTALLCAMLQRQGTAASGSSTRKTAA